MIKIKLNTYPLGKAFLIAAFFFHSFQLPFGVIEVQDQLILADIRFWQFIVPVFSFEEREGNFGSEFKLISLVLTTIAKIFQILQLWQTNTESILTIATSSQVKTSSSSATRQKSSTEGSASPWLIVILVRSSSHLLTNILSHFYWNKLCTIASVYTISGAGLSYVNMNCNPEDPSLKQVCDLAAITWAAVNYISKSYIIYVLKIDPATKETDRPIFQRHAQSEIMAAWVWGHFNEESLRASSLKSATFQ